MSQSTSYREPPAGFRSGDRHGWIDTICRRLAAVAHGQAAEELLGHGVPCRCAVAALPAWAWAPPAIDVGAKARARDGGQLTLPVRVAWATGPVALLEPGRTTVAGWSGVGLGHDTSGRTRLHPVGPAGARVGQDGRALVTGVDSLQVPDAIWYPVLTGPQARAELGRLAEAGVTARWEIVLSLEDYARSAVANVARRISREVGGPVRELDETTLAGLADELVLGAKDQPGAVLRLVTKALEPDRFARVDPQRWVRTELGRDAEPVVRRRLADPWAVGPKIRALSRQLGVTDPAELTAEYRARYPADRVAQARVERALLVSTDPITADCPLPLTARGPVTPSHEERVIAAVDRRAAAAAVAGRLDPAVFALPEAGGSRG